MKIRGGGEEKIDERGGGVKIKRGSRMTRSLGRFFFSILNWTKNDFEKQEKTAFDG